jgi:hypothetical protein
MGEIAQPVKRGGGCYMMAHLLANRPANVHLLIRSAQPRTLAAGGLLPDYCAALPEQARETIDVPAKGK